jgi:hypothetical protein
MAMRTLCDLRKPCFCGLTATPNRIEGFPEILIPGYS